MSRLADNSAYPPRGLRREEAARYVGIGTTKFDEMVSDGRMPKPKRMDGAVVWDRFALDAAFDALPDGDKSHEPKRQNTFDVVLGGGK